MAKEIVYDDLIREEFGKELLREFLSFSFSLVRDRHLTLDVIRISDVREIFELKGITLEDQTQPEMDEHDERNRKQERKRVTAKLNDMDRLSEYISTMKPDYYDGWLAAIKELRAYLEKETEL